MSLWVVVGGDGVCVRPQFWVSVLGQLDLQRPKQHGKDSGRSLTFFFFFTIKEAITEF